MKSLESIAKKIVLTLLFLAFLPSIYLLVVDLVQEVVSQPAPTPPAGPSDQHGSFGSGVVVAILVIILLAGVLTRLGNAMRNRDPYRAALDRRARMMPRLIAQMPDAPADRAVVDDDPDPVLR